MYYLPIFIKYNYLPHIYHTVHFVFVQTSLCYSCNLIHLVFILSFQNLCVKAQSLNMHRWQNLYGLHCTKMSKVTVQLGAIFHPELQEIKLPAAVSPKP